VVARATSEFQRSNLAIGCRPSVQSARDKAAMMASLSVGRLGILDSDHEGYIVRPLIDARGADGLLSVVTLRVGAQRQLI
jgi:hypothetical protein